MRVIENDTSTGFQFTDNYDGSSFDPVAIFASLKDIRVFVQSTGTTGVEISVSTITAVKDDSAKWHEVASVTGSDNIYVQGPVSAIRFTGDSADVEILAA